MNLFIDTQMADKGMHHAMKSKSQIQRLLINYSSIVAKSCAMLYAIRDRIRDRRRMLIRAVATHDGK